MARHRRFIHNAKNCAESEPENLHVVKCAINRFFFTSVTPNALPFLKKQKILVPEILLADKRDKCALLRYLRVSIILSNLCCKHKS